MQHIGIYSGTFDPVHNGHIAFAREALRTRRLDSVIFLPERVPRGKSGITEFATRVSQLGVALAESPELQILALDQPTFTLRETLPELRRRLGEAELTLLIGSDIVLHSFAQWPDISELLGDVSITVGVRGNHSQEELERVIGQIQLSNGEAIDAAYIYTRYPHLSSSQIREPLSHA